MSGNNLTAFSHRFLAFSLAGLLCTAAAAADGPALLPDQPLTDLEQPRGGGFPFHFTVPEGLARIRIRISGGSGDADLYLRFSEPPTLDTFDHRPLRTGNEESVDLLLPTPGTWHGRIHAHAAFEGLTLSKTHIPLPPDLGLDPALPYGDLELALFFELSDVAVPDESWNAAMRNHLLRREGRRAFDQGDPHAALEIWTRWREADPENEEPVSLIGDTHLRLGDLDAAITAYLESLRIRPGQIGLVVRLARLMDLQAARPDDARDLLNRYARSLPHHPELTLAQAEWLIRRRRYPEAETLIRAVLAEDPAHLGAITMLHTLLQDPVQRIGNFRQILAIGQQPGLEGLFARALAEHQLPARPESWVLMERIDQLSREATGELLREQFLRLLPRDSEAREDFRIGRMSRSWVSSIDQVWGEDGRLLLSADPTQAEAFLRLVGSEALHSGFVEATVEDSQGFFWLYARRSDNGMVRFGFDEDGRLFLQVWMGGILVNNLSRIWPRESGPVTLRLELRADGAFAAINGHPAFDHPVTLPRDLGLGWWGLAPWSPILGRARVAVREVAGGPLPVQLLLVPPPPERPRSRSEIDQLKTHLPLSAALIPDWYRQTAANRILTSLPEPDLELRLLSRYFRTRLLPLVRVHNPNSLPLPDLATLARDQQLDGFTLLLSRFPDPETSRRLSDFAIREGLALNFLVAHPDQQHAQFEEHFSGVGLFSGPRISRTLPLLPASASPRPPQDHRILQTAPVPLSPQSP